MLAIERRHHILNHLQENRRVLVADLAQEFSVSEETVRRDLDKLEQDGYVVKTYGGAFLKEESNVELPYFVRKKKNVVAKQLIAEQAATIVEDNDSVFLDGSSTALFIAKKLKGKKNLTVITNSVEVLAELVDAPDWKVISTGGTMKSGSFSLVGGRAESTARDFRVDKMFFSAKGVDQKGGITDADDENSAVKRVVAQSAKKVYLSVDTSKFGKVNFAKITDFSMVDGVICETKPSSDWLEFFTQNHITCLYPEA